VKNPNLAQQNRDVVVLPKPNVIQTLNRELGQIAVLERIAAMASVSVVLTATVAAAMPDGMEQIARIILMSVLANRALPTALV